MSSIPDKWTQSIFVGGGGAMTITQPAPVDSSIVLVITEIDIKVFCTAVGAAYASAFNVFDNGITSVGVPCLISLSGAAANESDTSSWTGALQTSAGASLVLLGTVLPANYGAIMSASGYAR